jgi:hypothetical protein
VVSLQSQSFLKDEVNNWNNNLGIPASLPGTTASAAVAFRWPEFIYYISPSLIFAADLSIKTSLPCNLPQYNHIEVLVEGCPTLRCLKCFSEEEIKYKCAEYDGLVHYSHVSPSILLSNFRQNLAMWVHIESHRTNFIFVCIYRAPGQVIPCRCGRAQ